MPHGTVFQIAISCCVAVAGIVALTREGLAIPRGYHYVADVAKPRRRTAPSLHVLPRQPVRPELDGNVSRYHALARHTIADGDRRFRGLASYYSEPQYLASGREYDPSALTAAHRTLPFGTRLRVSDPKSGKSVIVTVTDRGPFVPGRVLDLSESAARALDMIERGLVAIEAHVF